MTSIRFIQLERPSDLRTRRSEFGSTYSRTLSLLQRELGKLGASNIVIQAGFRPNQIRNDGWPYSSARPEHPAVVISFRSSVKDCEMAFPCARYDRYEDNVRAIALSLEALRSVDRYGVTQKAEQYRGWTALPAGVSDGMTPGQAAIWLASISAIPKDYILESEETRQKAYRIAARKLHPDTGGTSEDFTKLGKAMQVLRAASSAGKGV